MFTTVIIAALVALLFASFGTLIALKIQYRYLQGTRVQHKAWEHAQEGYLRNWETRQEKRSLGVESRITTRVQQIEKDWQAWERKDAGRIETLTQQYIQISADLHVERELARLPLVEETPLVFNSNGQRSAEFTSWQPPALARADLSGRDLSHRYLGQADLREAQLRGASFFMSDLSGACLAGANLTEADLTGANLSYADLRNSVLTNANLQVADLRHAVLLGADLHSAHNLTTQQIYSAIYDHTTQLDADVDLTMPRLPSISRSMLNQAARSQTLEVAPPVQPAPTTLETETNHEAEAARAKAPSAESTARLTEKIPDGAALLEAASTTTFSAEAPEALSDVEATNTVDMIDSADVGDVVETVEALEVAGEASLISEAEVPEPEMIEAERSLLAPLVFPRTIEDVAEDDTFVMPALNGHHSEKIAPSAADEPQPQEHTSEPESDPSSSLEPDGNAEDQQDRRILNARKNKHNTPNAPIDIATQKGKYHSTGKRRVRAR